MWMPSDKTLILRPSLETSKRPYGSVRISLSEVGLDRAHDLTRVPRQMELAETGVVPGFMCRSIEDVNVHLVTRIVI